MVGTIKHENGRIRIFRDFSFSKADAKGLLSQLKTAIDECPDSPEDILAEYLEMIVLDNDPRKAAKEIISELINNGYELNVQTEKKP